MTCLLDKVGLLKSPTITELELIYVFKFKLFFMKLDATELDAYFLELWYIIRLLWPLSSIFSDLFYFEVLFISFLFGNKDFVLLPDSYSFGLFYSLSSCLYFNLPSICHIHFPWPGHSGNIFQLLAPQSKESSSVSLLVILFCL